MEKKRKKGKEKRKLPFLRLSFHIRVSRRILPKGIIFKIIGNKRAYKIPVTIIEIKP